MSPKADAYKVVTDRIVEALEAGTVPWHKPWRSVRGEAPTSLSTGKEYRGINFWILSLTAAAGGYDSAYWATFNQAKEAAVKAAIREGREIVTEKSSRGKAVYYEIVNGERVLFKGGVRKGEKGTQIVLWKPFKKEVEKDGKKREEKFLMLRYFTVFNLDQCDGIKAPDAPELPEHDPIEACEQIARGYTSVEVKHGGNRAFYSPALDYVGMPQVGAFDTVEHYYGTLFHELAHSTGHESRLARKSLIQPTPFGTPDYSREELVAEMAAAFLCGEAGIEVNVQHHAGYIASWLHVLQNDRKLLVQAAAAAQKASDYVLGIEYTNGESSDSPLVNQRRRNHASQRLDPGMRSARRGLRRDRRADRGSCHDPGRARRSRRHTADRDHDRRRSQGALPRRERDRSP